MEQPWKEFLQINDLQIDQIRMAGYAYLKQGHYEKALTFFKALVVLDPNNPYDMQTLGAIQLEMGDYTIALDTLETALQFDRDHLYTQFNHATALLSLGYKKPAHTALTRLLHCHDSLIASKSEALLMAHFPQNMVVQK